MRWAVHSETLHSIRLSQFENITAAPPATAHSHTDKAGKQHMKSSSLSNPDELTVRQAAIFFYYAPTVHVDISLCQQPSPWGKSQSSRGAVLEGKTSLRVWHLICLSGHHFILSDSQTWHRVSLTCCVVVFLPLPPPPHIQPPPPPTMLKTKYGRTFSWGLLSINDYAAKYPPRTKQATRKSNEML